MTFKTWLIPLLFTLLTLSGCSDHDDTPSVEFTELQVTATQNPVPVGFPTQLTATEFFDDGTSHNIDAEWDSLDKTLATVNSSSGLVTTLAAGDVTIQATTFNGTGTIVLTVNSAVVESIQVTPDSSELPVGHNINFTATGTLSDGSEVSLHSHPGLAWHSSSQTVATISNEGMSDTLLEGSTTITAVLSANDELQQVEIISSVAELTVTPHIVNGIFISPISVIQPLGLTAAFTVEGDLSDGTKQDLTHNVVWSSSEPSIVEFVEINEEGAIFKSISLGRSSIVATYDGGVDGERETHATFLVEARELTSFTINNSTHSESQPLGKEVPYTATAEFTDGNSYNVSEHGQVYWQSNAIDTATVTTEGVVKGIKEGTVTITATTAYENVIAQKEIEITPEEIEEIMVKPINENKIISIGNTQQFDASARYTNGTVDEEIELHADFYWEAETSPSHNSNYYYTNPNILIDQVGLLTYVSNGSVPIVSFMQAHIGDNSGQARLLLPYPSVVSLPRLYPSQEFFGVLSREEADELGVQYSQTFPERLDVFVYISFVTMTYDEATQYCGDILYNGYNDWRLPNIDELNELWDSEVTNNENSDTFGHDWLLNQGYWSTSTGDVGHDVISLVNGSITNTSDETVNYASCVRDVD